MATNAGQFGKRADTITQAKKGGMASGARRSAASKRSTTSTAHATTKHDTMGEQLK